jgi:hypothetical protein
LIEQTGQKDRELEVLSGATSDSKIEPPVEAKVGVG